jgi:hypothetical protein
MTEGLTFTASIAANQEQEKEGADWSGIIVHCALKEAATKTTWFPFVEPATTGGMTRHWLCSEQGTWFVLSIGNQVS